jgi:hypothetical protein
MTGILNVLLGFLRPGGFTVIQTFTSSTSWVAPEGVTEVEYLVVAGGGVVAVGVAAAVVLVGLELQQGFLLLLALLIPLLLVL